MLPRIYLSDIDKDRFGVITARLGISTVDDISVGMKFCRDHKVQLLIARCKVDDFMSIHQLEQTGFLLMDTLVYYARRLHGSMPPLFGKATIRKMRVGEDWKVASVAEHAFRGYGSHYHADTRLDQGQCDQVYVSWASNLSRQSNDSHRMFFAEMMDGVVGFGGFRPNNEDELEGVLFGVHPKQRRKGIYHDLLVSGMCWGKDFGANEMLISTQITNQASQRAWTKLGFMYSHSYYTFHKWFD